jgi:hypothetical protein
MQGPSLKVEFQLADAAKFLPCTYDNFVWFTDQALTESVRHEVPLYDGTLPLGGEMPSQVTGALEHFLNEHKIQGHVTATLNGKLGEPPSAYSITIAGLPMPVTEVRATGPLGPDLLARATHTMVGADYSRSIAQRMADYGLTEVYQDEGYLQVQFSAPHAEMRDPQLLDASQGIIVSYVATPGPLYTWNGIVWNGTLPIPEAELNGFLKFNLGDVARRGQLEIGMMGVQNDFGRLGHLEAHVDLKPEFDVAGRRVRYQASVTEGPQYLMGDFTVTGIGEPFASRLQNAWKLKPGSIFDASYEKTYLTKGVAGSMPAGSDHRFSFTFRRTLNHQTHVVSEELQVH